MIFFRVTKLLQLVMEMIVFVATLLGMDMKSYKLMRVKLPVLVVKTLSAVDLTQPVCTWRWNKTYIAPHQQDNFYIVLARILAHHILCILIEMNVFFCSLWSVFVFVSSKIKELWRIYLFSYMCILIVHSITYSYIIFS